MSGPEDDPLPEAVALVEGAARAGLRLRLLGGLGVRVLCPGFPPRLRAGQTMQQMVESVQRVNALVGTMRQANQAQATGVGEVNLAVANLDQMTQQNAALVEQSAVAAASLRDQAAHLLEAVQVFKLRST